MLGTSMSRAETVAHLNLKRLAVQWAQAEGFSLCGLEISIPRSGYRADVVGATPNISSPSARVAVFECKQARADWLRDSANEAATAQAARENHERLVRLRELIAVHRPDLRRGETLFPEFDAYDYTGLRHETLVSLEAELRCLQRKLSDSTKFDRLFRYAAADFFFLITEDNLIESAEVPAGWGWLVREGEKLILRARPVAVAASIEQRVAILERIARKGTRSLNRELGLPIWSSPDDEAPTRSFATGR
jgi:hypothetical protein